mmetsp:Transcript_29190/g.68603  ORF Transcript_29190/g.68603 Transcript_29190/m.68603 type:complete len:209 (-) Transcript_29190:67-693(-)
MFVLLFGVASIPTAAFSSSRKSSLSLLVMLSIPEGDLFLMPGILDITLRRRLPNREEAVLVRGAAAETSMVSGCGKEFPLSSRPPSLLLLLSSSLLSVLSLSLSTAPASSSSRQFAVLIPINVSGCGNELPFSSSAPSELFLVAPSEGRIASRCGREFPSSSKIPSLPSSLISVTSLLRVEADLPFEFRIKVSGWGRELPSPFRISRS